MVGKPDTTGTPEKVAMIDFVVSMVTVQVAALPVQAPLHPMKLAAVAGVAVRMICVPGM